ncbi:MAG: rhodanese-like domain-containing protein [bacterium]
MFLRLIGKWTTPISYAKAKALVASGGELIDVRNPEEYAREHLPGARNIPLDQVVVRLTGAQERAYIFYCQSGLRSQRAAQTLKRRGLGKVYNLGAMARWDETPEVNAMVEPREANRPA